MNHLLAHLLHLGRRRAMQTSRVRPRQLCKETQREDWRHILLALVRAQKLLFPLLV